MERTILQIDEGGVTYMRKHPFKTTMDYILNESDINDELISKSYEIDKFIHYASEFKFKKGLYIDVQIAQSKQNNLQWLSVLRTYKDHVNYCNILDGKLVPVSKHIFEKLEKLNLDYYFNVYDWDDKVGIQPIIVLKNYERSMKSILWFL
ncbi:10078_t:CDS:2 [Entrophospora sp. SA101]|nr:10078_t:CDS:2 [Entrophospora sp. SA101]